MLNVKITTIASAAAALILALAAAPALAQNAPASNSGTVYPGQPVQQTPQAPQAAQPGQPGQPVGIQALPALPGAAGPQAVRPGSIAVDDVMPSTLANDVREMKRRMDDFGRAQNQSAGPVAKPVTRSITITQAAGEEPPVVRVAQGIPSNIVFIDSSGQPWPIEHATPGDSNKFEVMMPSAGTSSLQIRPKQSYGYGGISVTLKGNPVPISLTLTVGQSEVDSRLDVKMSRRGPNAAAPIIDRTGLPHATDVSLMSFLDGVPPQGANEAKSSERNVRAWRWNGRLVVRSEYPVVSPAWSDSTSSPNGLTHAYILPDVPSILVSAEGRMVTVQID